MVRPTRSLELTEAAHSLVASTANFFGLYGLRIDNVILAVISSLIRNNHAADIPSQAGIDRA
jgi:hypothetical protein